MKLIVQIIPILALISCVRNQRVVYECNFDLANNIDGCNGQFSYAANGQVAGVVQYLDAFNTELKYDLTDLTSTKALASNGLPCNIPFYYNARYNNFCVKFSDPVLTSVYKCQTSTSFSDCSLGKFFGIKATSPSSYFAMSFEIKSPIVVTPSQLLNLQFSIFYNCYQSKSVLDFFRSDCSDVMDRLTIYYKTAPEDLYSILKVYEFGKKNNGENWRPYNLDIIPNTKLLYMKITFERISAASKGEAIFGLDGLTITDNQLIILSTLTSTNTNAVSTVKPTTAGALSSSSSF